MRIVCISDTHNFHDQVKLPEGDVLVHSGDFTISGKMSELIPAANWLKKQLGRFREVVCTPGNHDFACQHFLTMNHMRSLYEDVFAGIKYLQDESTIIDGVKFWGSPWQPWFMDWAFNLPRGSKLAEKWAAIPDDVNVLVTHTPPKTYRDWVGQDRVGCLDLANRIQKLPDLRLHVFGHIHGGYGMTKVDGKKFVNASVVNEAYQVTNEPIVVEI